MANQLRQADGPFQRSPLPASLWPAERVAQEFRAGEQTIRRWVREGSLPGPCLRRGGRAYWNPAEIERHRRNRLHRIGAG